MKIEKNKNLSFGTLTVSVVKKDMSVKAYKELHNDMKKKIKEYGGQVFDNFKGSKGDVFVVSCILKRLPKIQLKTKADQKNYIKALLRHIKDTEIELATLLRGMGDIEIDKASQVNAVYTNPGNRKHLRIFDRMKDIVNEIGE